MNYEFRDSEESKRNNITYHLAIVEEWTGQKDTESYTPSAFEQDGFIHCTNGLDQLVEVANMFYTKVRIRAPCLCWRWTRSSPRSATMIRISDSHTSMAS